MPTTGIGLLGCGLWGRKILADLVELGVRTVLVDPDPGAREWAQGMGASAVLAALPANAELDGWIVATPASLHRASLAALAPFGLPILCEKPLAASAADLAAIKDLRLERCHMLDVWRYHPAVAALRALVISGELGEALGLHSTRANWTSPRTDVDSIWNLAPHEVSIYVSLFQRYPEPLAALAEVHGGQARGLSAHWRGGPWLVSDLSNRAPTRRRELRLQCTEGVAVFDGARPAQLLIASGPADSALEARDRRVVELDSTPALRLQLAAWIGHLHGGPAPRSSLQHGIEVVQRMLTLRRLAGFAS